MKLPKLRELKEAIKAVFSPRYTTKFPASKHEAALDFRGAPVPDEDWCIGCEACMEACPTGAIEIEDSPKDETRKIIRLYDRCIYCGQCEEKCPQPEPGVKLTREYDMADYSREDMKVEQEFDLIVCSKCGEALGTRDQLEATARRMGPALASTNPDLMLVRQEKRGFGQLPSKSREVFYRSDIFEFLCPRCRHKVYSTEANNE
ncbi:MAG: 4Fe-4S binding protein [Elusimicrobiota bacterium]